MEMLGQDVRYSLRKLRRSPGFTTVALLSLALGIGANTAIFSLVYTLLLHRLPVRDPGQLVELLHQFPGEPQSNGFPWQTYRLMREHNHAFAGLIAAAYQPVHVRSESMDPQIAESAFVDGTFFSVLGVRPAIGRLVGPDDDRAENPAGVAVVSWSYWRSRFNLDTAILGRQILVENVPVTVVGVLPRGFGGLKVEARQEIWLPLATQPIIFHTDSSPRSVDLVGRLKPGISLDQARAEMAVLYESTLDEQAKATNNPFLRQMKFEMAPAGAGLSHLRQEFAKPLLVLMTVVGVLLLIACTNIASLLLARGAARESEMALRVSLGASRWRLVRQGLTESFLLSAGGSLLGMGVAYFGATALVRVILAAPRPGPPLELQVRTDFTVLLFTAAIALLTGLLFGIAPSLRALRSTPSSSLHDAGRSGAPRQRQLAGKALVVAQVALSVVLLSAAGLFVGHLSNLEHLDVGFQRDHVLLVKLDFAGSGYEGERLTRAYEEMLARLAAIPGVSSATICQVSPLQGPGANRGVNVEGYEVKPGEIRNVMENWVGPSYFKTLGIPLLAGRDFSLQDRGRPRVAIVNQSMARYYFGSGDALGHHVIFDGDTEPYEIIGVAGDAKYYDMREATWRTIYLNTFQEPEPASQFALRTSLAPASVAPDVRRTVSGLLKTVSVGHITTLADQVDASIVPERLVAMLSGCFGALGSLLVAIGLYGLLAFTVARRTNEIGVRMALGATQGDVARMVLVDALKMACAGLLIGAPIAWWGKSFAASKIEGLTVTNVAPVVFGVVAMIAIALLSAYLPARRAAGVEPMQALRHE